MNVLSLFDGMSCGMIALDRLGIKVDNYYASEIDKYAIQVSQANYPDIIQVGDITKLDLSTLPKIDLVMGGSPCQGFSFAGKQLAFDDPRSALFFEFHKAISYLQPKYFLLENVRMKKEYLDIISEYMGVEPIFINSSLVSAQSRQRYYWTNIPGIEQPEERGIVLRDILEDQVGSEHYVGDNMQKNYKGGNQLNPNYKSQANTIHNSDKKSGTICAGTHGYANGYVGDKHKPVKQTERNARHLKQLDDKSLCMTATMYKGAGNNGMTLVPQKIHDIPKDVLKDNERQRRVYSKEGKSPTLLARSDSPKVMKSDKPQHIGTAVDIKGHDQIKRVYSPDGKSPTVTTCGGGHREPKVVSGAYRARSVDENGKRVAWKDTKPKQMLELRKDEKSNSVTSVQKDNVLTQDKVYWRKLTPLECERLQTVPDNYTNHVSNTQRYKMLGNGWTIEVIAHILQNMEIDNV
jgi:DNA (cytosine-5)-methyltransferase 3A